MNGVRIAPPLPRSFGELVESLNGLSSRTLSEVAQGAERAEKTFDVIASRLDREWPHGINDPTNALATRALAHSDRMLSASEGGDWQLLVIFASTKDQRIEDVDGVKRAINNMCAFYEQESNDLVRLKPVYVEVTLPQTYAYYEDGDYGFGAWPMNSQRMAWDAMTIIKDEADTGEDFTRFDIFGTGRVPGYLLIRPGSDASVGAEGRIWAHKWQHADVETDDGIVFSEYASLPEKLFDTIQMGHGLYTHEMGHIFGLPDLYGRGTNYGLGVWSLMSYGSWNGLLGNDPARLTLGERWQLGWVNPRVLDGHDESVIETLAVGNMQVIFPDPGDRQRYYTLEYRNETSLPAKGWQLILWNEREPNNMYGSRTSLFQTDTASLSLNSRGDRGDVFPSNGSLGFDESKTIKGDRVTSVCTDMTGNFITSGIRSLGDVDRDGDVDMDDIMHMVRVLYYGGNPFGWEDINEDGLTDSLDLNIVIDAYIRTTNAVTQRVMKGR